MLDVLQTTTIVGLSILCVALARRSKQQQQEISSLLEAVKASAVLYEAVTLNLRLLSGSSVKHATAIQNLVTNAEGHQAILMRHEQALRPFDSEIQ